MGGDADQTVREIEVVRERLDDELDELRARLPATVRRVRRTGLLAVGGVAVAGTLWLLGKRRRAKKQEILENPAERWIEAAKVRLEDDTTRRWVIGAGVAWALLRIAELRYLRRINRALPSV
jgi:hypothetical protein